MTPPSRDDRTPADRVNDIETILQVMSEAVRQALMRHKQAGNQVVVWRNGRAEWIQPDDIPVETR